MKTSLLITSLLIACVGTTVFAQSAHVPNGRTQGDSISHNEDGSLTVTNPRISYLGEYMALKPNDQTAVAFCKLIGKTQSGTVVQVQNLKNYDKPVVTLDQGGGVTEIYEYDESPSNVDVIANLNCR